MWTSGATRGCGDRSPGGVYLCSGGGNTPIDLLYLDPPLPLPQGLDLINKTQMRPRIINGVPQIDPVTKEPIYDVYMQVGSESYPEIPDFGEEAGRHGISRKVNPNMDLSKLSINSWMIFAHAHAIPQNWQELKPVDVCRQGRPLHMDHCPVEFCIFKLWELLPGVPGVRNTRTIGSTTYTHEPTGEQVTGWTPGLFLRVAISGIELPRRNDEKKTTNEKAKKWLAEGAKKHGAAALTFEEVDH